MDLPKTASPTNGVEVGDQNVKVVKKHREVKKSRTKRMSNFQFPLLTLQGVRKISGRSWSGTLLGLAPPELYTVINRYCHPLALRGTQNDRPSAHSQPSPFTCCWHIFFICKHLIRSSRAQWTSCQQKSSL